jgi:hypothetical protein
MMTFPRLHLFELEDQPWFPAIIRDLATDYLSFMQTTLGLHRPIVPVLAKTLGETGRRQIVDLCSGGGGPLPEIQKELSAAGLNTSLVMTDRFPNLRAFQRIAELSGRKISFIAQPVDARSVPDQLRGFRTIFNSFHHFREADAREILRNAVAAGEPIAIFEYPERAALIILLTLLLTPFVVALATPFIRPFRWSRLILTYLLPIIPLTCWWDGVVSHLRAYDVSDLRDLAKNLTSYDWQTRIIALPRSPGHLTYLVGRPR